MRKLLKILIILCIILSYSGIDSYAENEEIFEEQMKTLNISDFISETQKYTDESIGEININEILTSAITGKVENKNLVKKVLDIFGNEVRNAIKVMRKYTDNYIDTQYFKEYKW